MDSALPASHFAAGSKRHARAQTFAAVNSARPPSVALRWQNSEDPRMPAVSSGVSQARPIRSPVHPRK